MKKIKSVTIGIPAHNEAKNISLLLNSIVMQKQLSYKLDSVIVLCDGCTDNTSDIARKYEKQYKYISQLKDGKRIGKSPRLNQLFKLNQSDIVIIFDGDTVLANQMVVEKIVEQ